MSSSSSVASPEIPPLGHAIGGALGSALALLLFYPLERARIEMQADAATTCRNTDESARSRIVSDSSSESWVSCVEPEQEMARSQAEAEQESAGAVQPPVHQNGLLPTLARLYDTRELYQGAGSVVITLATSSFIFFYAHQLLHDILVRRKYKKTAVLSLLGSSLAGIVNVLITNPMWVANMKIVKGSKASLWRELQHIVQSDGWKSLWNGTGASLLLVSNPVLQFFVYEQVRASRLKARVALSPIDAFCIGALAKAIATIATYPLQLAQVLLRLRKGVGTDTGTWDCLKHQFDRGGVKALYTGMNAKLLQTVLTAAFTFLTYEQILRAVRTALLMTAQKKERQRMYLGGSNI